MPPTPHNKKIAFFGTPAFTTEFLDLLTTEGYIVSLVVTTPDRKSGRGQRLTAPAPKTWALAHNIPFLQPEKLTDDFFEGLSKEQWDLFIVVAYGKIIPERIITLPKYGTINVHYSLLPKYRGATPVESAILNGDTITGVTIQQMAYELDSGDILLSKEVAVDRTDTTETVRNKLNKETLQLLPQVLGAIFDNTIIKTPQSTEGISRCGKIAKTNGKLNLSDDPITLDRTFRAYKDNPGTFFIHNGKRVKIKEAHFLDGKFIVDMVIPENSSLQPYEQFIRNNPTATL